MSGICICRGGLYIRGHCFTFILSFYFPCCLIFYIICMADIACLISSLFFYLCCLISSLFFYLCCLISSLFFYLCCLISSLFFYLCYFILQGFCNCSFLSFIFT